MKGKRKNIQNYANEEARARLSCDISNSTKDRLEKLLELMDALTMTEVIRRSTELADVIYDAKKKGSVIVLVSQDGSKTTLLLV